MGWGKKSKPVLVDDIKGGCNYNPDVYALTVNESPNSMNVEYYMGRWRKRSGYEPVTTSLGGNVVGYSLIDFGAVSGIHRQVAHFGGAVYAMNNMDGNLVSIRSDAPRVRSYNAKVKSYLVQTYADYSAPYYWNGSASSMSLLSASAPAFKRAIEFSGFLMAANTSANKMRVWYESIDTAVGGSFSSYFTLTPAPNDDEITSWFVINGRLYAGTKYSIFRVSFVGGIVVFSYTQVISSVGVVPDTAQVVITKDFGQVAIFLGTDMRLYLFDGANVKHISDSFAIRNDSTQIALDLIDAVYRDNCFAVVDMTNRIYKLFVTRYGETQNRFCLNVDVDSFAYYPFDSMPFSAAATCYDRIGRFYLLGASTNGKLQNLTSVANTDDGVAIVDYWESAVLSAGDGLLQQGQEIGLTLLPSGGFLNVQTKVDHAVGWTNLQRLPLFDSRDQLLGQNFTLGNSTLGYAHEVLMQGIMTPKAYNVLRVRLFSGAAITPRWEMLKMNVDQTPMASGRAEPHR